MKDIPGTDQQGGLLYGDVFRRRRFREVIERQLAFFEQDDPELLDDVDRALEKYDRAERDEAEDLYGDYQLAIEAATDRLAELRDTYARTLEENAEQYEREFNAAVVERWRDLALTIEESRATRQFAVKPTIVAVRRNSAARPPASAADRNKPRRPRSAKYASNAAHATMSATDRTNMDPSAPPGERYAFQRLVPLSR